ncbi:MAG: helix-turn-helix domain-containing protein [Acutalibacteraceae bacterium]
MEFNFSENLKNLRLSKKYTQEQVAEFLNCSVQAVSRWECGNTLPDIMTLPSLARLYSTTVDSLLGADFEKSKAELEDYFKLRQEYTHNGQSDKAYELTKQMYEKYPSESNVQLFMVYDSYNCFYLDDEQERKQRLKEAIKYAMRHLEITDDIERKCKYITYIAYSYKNLGDFDNAVEWAKKLPSEWSAVGFAMRYILSGEESVDNDMDLLNTHLQIVILYMEHLADINYVNEKTPYEFWQRVDILKKIAELIKLFFENGDYGFFNVRLSNAYRQIAACYANCKMADETLEYLELAVECSEKFEQLYNSGEKFKHTSLLFKDFEYAPSEWTRGDDCSHTDVIYQKLTTQERYDFLRDDERFVALINRIDQKKS